jgi:hypothetical protein
MSAATERKPRCFVISPIGSDNSDVRGRADKILTHIIAPVADECGYEALRADKISEPGMITTQVIQHIMEDPMVVADLTDQNANVFYELAVRHIIRKPFVQLIQKGQRIPFDTAGIRTIELDHTDLDSVASAKMELKKQIQYTAANPDKIQNPIIATIDLEKLRESDNPEKRQIAEILTGMSELRQLLIAVGVSVNYSIVLNSRTGTPAYNPNPLAYLTPAGGFTAVAMPPPPPLPTSMADTLKTLNVPTKQQSPQQEQPEKK